MLLKPPITGIIFSLFLVVAPTYLSAQEYLFHEDQWDEENIFLNESLSEQIESILLGNPRFEPLAGYLPESQIRRLSRPVGRLRIRYPNGKFTTCTATLVARDRIITNNHCVPGSGKHGEVVEVKLELGVYNIINPRRSVYPVDINPIETNKAFDYSILSISPDAGDKYGWSKLKPQLLSEGADLTVIHHPAGRVKHVTRSGCVAGPVTKRATAHIAHKCDTLPGSSGAPIFNDENEIVAIHCCGTLERGEDAYNYGKLIAIISRSKNLERFGIDLQEVLDFEHTNADAGSPFLSEVLQTQCEEFPYTFHARKPFLADWAFAEPGITAIALFDGARAANILLPSTKSTSTYVFPKPVSGVTAIEASARTDRWEAQVYNVATRFSDKESYNCYVAGLVAMLPEDKYVEDPQSGYIGWRGYNGLDVGVAHGIIQVVGAWTPE